MRWAFQGGLAIPSKNDPENVTLKTTGVEVIKNFLNYQELKAEICG